MMQLSGFHPDFPRLAAVDRVRAMTFREAGCVELICWIMVYGLDNCPKDAIWSIGNAVEQTKAFLAKITRNPEARYSSNVYGGLEIGRMYAENSSQGV